MIAASGWKVACLKSMTYIISRVPGWCTFVGSFWSVFARLGM